MAWSQPKTDWNPTDSFSFDIDYGRIRGNILYLQELARRLYLPFPLEAMGDYGLTAFPFVEFFSSVDNNVDTLMDSTFRPPRTERARTYRPGGRVWNADDLNRIEKACLTLYQALQGQQNALPRLAFTLGGGAFGACI